MLGYFPTDCSSSRRVSSIYFASFRFQHGEGNSTIQHWTWLTILVRKVTACSCFRSHPHPYSEKITDLPVFAGEAQFFFWSKFHHFSVVKSWSPHLNSWTLPYFCSAFSWSSADSIVWFALWFFSGQTASKGQRSSFFQSFSIAWIPTFSGWSSPRSPWNPHFSYKKLPH